MRHLLPLFCFVCVLWNESTSNPIVPPQPYQEVGITEVYVASPIDWYIELDGTWCMAESKNVVFPCSSDVYLLIKSGSSWRGKYRARVGFSANRLGVVSQGSLRVFSSQGTGYIPMRLQLRNTDTVMITMDTSQKAAISSPPRPVQYWSIPLRPVPGSNSLVGFKKSGDNKITYYSTSRRSIGSRGDYTTKFRITLQDMYGNPLKFLSPNRPGTMVDAAGTYSVPIAIYDTDTLLIFKDHNTLHYSTIEPFKMSVFYSDTVTLIEKTVPISVTQYMVTVNNPYVNSILHWYKKCSNTYSYFSSGQSYFLLRAYPSIPTCPICIALTELLSGSDCLATLEGGYIDTADIIQKTFTIPSSGMVGTRAADARSVKTGITLTGLVQSNREVRMVVSSTLPAARGILSIYAINGKKIQSLPVAMNGSGTSTVLFRFQDKQLSPGRYLCKLTIAGFSPEACQITIP